MSIKTNISYLFSLALLPLLAACGQDSSPLAPTPPVGDEPVEIRLAARMTGVDVSVTRAIIPTDDDLAVTTNTEFGVYGINLKLDGDNSAAKDDLSSENVYINNSILKPQTAPSIDAGGVTSFSLTGTTQKLYMPAGKAGTTAQLIVYAPYQATPTVDGTDLTIPVKSGWAKTTDATATDVTDPRWAKTLVTKVEDQSSTTANLEFGGHRMARLDIAVSSQSKADEVTYHVLHGLEVTFTNAQTGNMSLNSGKITSDPKDDKRVYQTLFSGTNLLPKEETTATVSSHTVIPYEGEGSAVQSIRIQVGNSDQWFEAYDAETYKDAPIKFTAGKLTKVHITFNPGTNAQGTLIDWETDEELNYDFTTK